MLLTKRGLFIGLTGLDVVYYGSSFPKENCKTKYDKVATYCGGPACNAALTYALLGGDATLLTNVGSSSVGHMIKKDLEGYGIEVVDMCGDFDIKNVSSIYVNTKTGERTILSGRNKVENEIDIRRAYLAMKGCYFCLYDGHFARLDDFLITNKAPIILDLGNYDPRYEALLSEKAFPIASSAFAAGCDAEALFKEKGCRYYAITNGEKPIVYRVKDNYGEIEVPSVKAIDTLGAGDIFHGAFVAFYFNSPDSAEEALQKAAMFASLSTEVEGVIEGILHAKKVMRL